ncbi:MAG: hypothetical protein ABSG73_11105 [Candidatus Aminicenantales bacterium]|jgi:hypothetical protein
MIKLDGNRYFLRFWLVVSLAFTLFTPPMISAQVLVQDSKGSSSILYHGCTIGLNLSEAAFEFDYNNFSNRYVRDFRGHLVWGFQLSAQNKDGVANLLDTGKWTPEAKGVITLGYSLSNLNAKSYAELSRSIDLLNREITGLDNGMDGKTKAMLDGYLKSIKDKKDSDKLIAELKSIVGEKDFRDLAASIQNLASKFPEFGRGLLSFADEISINIGQDLQSKNEKLMKLKGLEIEQRNYRATHRYIMAVFYANIGLSANSFKYYNENSTGDFKSRFEDKNFIGPLINIGANLQWGGRYIFGISGGLKRINNLESLSKKEFTLQSVEILGSQVLIDEKKITAFAGTYGTLNQYNLSADILRFHKLGIQQVIVSHLYLRHNITANTNLVPTQTNAGLGVYYFKNNGAFLGGLYVEAPDIANNIEKHKAEPKLKPLYNRIKFGIIAKITFGSLSSIN